jgi:hypothetical protein
VVFNTSGSARTRPSSHFLNIFVLRNWADIAIRVMQAVVLGKLQSGLILKLLLGKLLARNYLLWAVLVRLERITIT